MAHRRKRRLSEDEIEQALSCPICLESFTIPIYQCRNKHLICEYCYSKIKLINDKCPQCRARFKLSPVRNKKAERMLEKYETVCRYASRGCTEKRTYEERTKHEKRCNFSTEVKCPALEARSLQSGANSLRGCSWEGDIECLLSHLRTSHSLQMECFHTNVGSLSVDIGTCCEEDVNAYEWAIQLPLGNLYVQSRIEYGSSVKVSVVPLCLGRSIKSVEVSYDYLKDEASCMKPFYGMRFNQQTGRKCTFYFDFNELVTLSPERFTFRVRTQ
jgi:hypothetical protein